MKNVTKKVLALVVALILLVSVFSACSKSNNGEEQASAASAASSENAASTSAPIEFTMTYADNPTFPFNQDWLSVTESQKFVNAKIKFEVIPYNDYQDKVTLELNSGSAPDVITYIKANEPPYSTFGLNGALVALNKYEKQTPNFTAQVSKYNLGDEVKKNYLADSNLYYLPALYSAAFYDGGPLIRTDLLEKYGLKTPTTYDELYEVMKVFKKNEPNSYPLTSLVASRVLFRFTMPSFGISVGKNSSSRSYVLSYDYDKKEYFAGAISDQYKEYLKYFSKLYAEGLLDPEYVNNPNDTWASKMSTGKSMVTWAYYDQIGGLIGNSTVDGMKLEMLPPLKGPGGAFTQPKSVTDYGIAFPTTATKRDDFEKLVETVDKLFFSPEMATLFGQGVEGVTFDKVDGNIKYKDEYVNASDGLYKSLQIKNGVGTNQLQHVWDLPTELLKYDATYAAINKTVAEMKGIQTIPPMPKFTTDQAEEAALLQAPLADMFEVWTDAFIIGAKSIDKDWDAYVAEAKSKGIEKYLTLYNDVLNKN